MVFLILDVSEKRIFITSIEIFPEQENIIRNFPVVEAILENAPYLDQDLRTECLIVQAQFIRCSNYLNAIMYVQHILMDFY